MSMVQLMQAAVPSTARFSSVGVPAWRSSLPPLPRGRKRPVLALSYSSGNSTGRSVGCSGRRPEPASFGSLYVQGLGSRQGWRFTCHELPRLQRKLRRLVRYSRNCSYSCQAASSTDGRCGDIPPEPGRQETESQQIHYHVDPKWRLIGNCMRAAFLIWGAASCVSWVSGAGQAWAAESGSVLIPPVGRAMEFWGRFWPKTLQVFGVFRDQGVLLSVLLGLSAFFSMAETSITTLWPWKVRELAEKEQEGGVFQLLRNDVTRFLTTILIGTTVANIAATALVTDAATALFGEAGISAATGVMTVVILLVTEIAPKSIAVHNATEVARVVVRPVAWLSLILYPVGRVVTALSTNLLKFLGLKHSGEPFVSEEELKLMLRGAELSGAIEEEEQDMIENVLEIKDTYVREVMTPLVDVVAIDSEATLMDFRQLWVTHQYSRVPVFERRVDNIVGIAYAMDMLDYVEQVELLQRLSVGRIAHRPAYFVPDSMSVWNLLREFRIRKVHMAIVLNEYGGAVGVVTLEDVVEEIVGEIFDENDSKEEIRKKTGYVIQRADGIFDVDANTSIEDLKDALEIKVPEGPYHYETVSGFVCEAFGYIPRTGESIPVVFEKADIEDGADRREGEQDHQDDRKEKFQWYKLEILAGNARKVGSVRFERAEGSQAKETAMNRNPSRAVKRAWEDRDSSSAKDKRVSKEWDDVGYDLDPPESKDVEQVCIVESSDDERNESTVRRRYLIAESVDVVASESPCQVADGLTVVGQQDWQIDSLAQQNREQGFETDDEVETSTATTMGTLCEKWEEQERQVERRRQRRRKQSAEATVELSRQRKGDVRRRESDMATTMYRMRGGRDDSFAA